MKCIAFLVLIADSRSCYNSVQEFLLIFSIINCSPI